MTTLVRCPTCKQHAQWSELNTSRPFCSARCKDIDLGSWASDTYVVEGAAPSTAQELEALEQAFEAVQQSAV